MCDVEVLYRKHKYLKSLEFYMQKERPNSHNLGDMLRATSSVMAYMGIAQAIEPQVTSAPNSKTVQALVTANDAIRIPMLVEKERFPKVAKLAVVGVAVETAIISFGVYAARSIGASAWQGAGLAGLFSLITGILPGSLILTNAIINRPNKGKFDSYDDKDMIDGAMRKTGIKDPPTLLDISKRSKEAKGIRALLTKIDRAGCRGVSHIPGYYYQPTREVVVRPIYGDISTGTGDAPLKGFETRAVEKGPPRFVPAKDLLCAWPTRFSRKAAVFSSDRKRPEEMLVCVMGRCVNGHWSNLITFYYDTKHPDATQEIWRQQIQVMATSSNP